MTNKVRSIPEGQENVLVMALYDVIRGVLQNTRYLNQSLHKYVMSRNIWYVQYQNYDMSRNIWYVHYCKYVMSTIHFSVLISGPK